jgi:hypothetical protein
VRPSRVRQSQFLYVQSEATMNRLSRHEQVLLEQLVAEKDRQRRIQNESRLQLPLYDKVIPASEESRHHTVEPLDPRWLSG